MISAAERALGPFAAQAFHKPCRPSSSTQPASEPTLLACLLACSFPTSSALALPADPTHHSKSSRVWDRCLDINPVGLRQSSLPLLSLLCVPVASLPVCQFNQYSQLPAHQDRQTNKKDIIALPTPRPVTCPGTQPRLFTFILLSARQPPAASLFPSSYPISTVLASSSIVDCLPLPLLASRVRLILLEIRLRTTRSRKEISTKEVKG